MSIVHSVVCYCTFSNDKNCICWRLHELLSLTHWSLGIVATRINVSSSNICYWFMYWAFPVKLASCYIDDKSALVQAMAWCRKAPSHCLTQCWLRSLTLGHKELTVIFWVQVYSTYSVEEYNRKNDNVDPMAASAEYELEKRVERMELFPVELIKGNEEICVVAIPFSPCWKYHIKVPPWMNTRFWLNVPNRGALLKHI